MNTTYKAKPSLIENITVHQVGKFGIRVDEKTWYNTNEPLKPESFMAGTSYKVGVTVSKSGKKYISEILGVEEASEATAPKPVAKAPAVTASVGPVSGGNFTVTEKADTKAKIIARAKMGEPLTEYDLKIQRQINRSSNWNAAMNSPFIGQYSNTFEEYLAAVRKAADAGVEYTGE